MHETPEQIKKKYFTRPRAWFMLAVLALTAYAPVLRVGFLWDDHVLVEENPYIRSWSWDHLKHDFSTTVSNGQGDEGFLRPVVTWSNRLNYSLWKLNAAGYHLTSLLLHIANVILLYEFFLLLGFSPIATFLAAALFGVHPIGVEGQLCVTGRATFLSFFFSLITLCLLVRPNPSRVLFSTASFALALLSKEQSAVVPLLVPLLWVLKGTFRKHALSSLPLFFVLALYLYFRHHLFGSVGMPHEPLYALRFYLQAFPRVLNHYVELLLVPWNLHSHRLILRMSPIWMLSLLGWAACAIWSWKNKKRYPWAFWCVSWMVIGMLPTSIQMIYGGFMLDHWGYWVAPAVFLPVGLLVEWLWLKQKDRRWRAAAGLYFPVLIVYALLVRLNIELRNTDEKMFRWALAFTTSSPIRYNYGALLLLSGRAREAIPYFAAVRELYPENLDNQHALALAYWHSGAVRAGANILEDIVKSHPAYEPAQQSLKAIQKIPMRARKERHPS